MEKPNISTPPQTNLPPKPEINPVIPSPSPKFSPPLIATFVLLLVLVGTIGFFLGKSLGQPKTPSPPPISQVSPTPTPTPEVLTPTPDPTANWKTYTNEKYKYEFKYPNEYKIVKSENREVILKNQNNKSILIVNKDNTINYKSIRKCEINKDWQQPLPCLWTKSVLGTNFEQEEDIQDIKLDSVKSKSFYVQEGIVDHYHVIQTIEEPILEIKIFMLDDKHDLILSTFKFLD